MTARDRHTEASSTGYDDSGHNTQPECLGCGGCPECWGEPLGPSSPPADDPTPLDPEVLTQLRAAAPEVLAALVSSGPVAKARNEAGRSSMPITLDDYAWLAAAAAAFTDLLAAAEDAARVRVELERLGRSVNDWRQEAIRQEDGARGARAALAEQTNRVTAAVRHEDWCGAQAHGDCCERECDCNAGEVLAALADPAGDDHTTDGGRS